MVRILWINFKIKQKLYIAVPCFDFFELEGNWFWRGKIMVQSNWMRTLGRDFWVMTAGLPINVIVGFGS